jgi:5-methyltetrahydropteroyltriglutamate--homocysteine methyltransferase
MDRILTTHVGSLLRPERLKADLVAQASGDCYDDEAFQSRLQADVAEVVRSQVATGLDVVDDGEYGKLSWLTYIYNRVRGVEPRKIRYTRADMLALIPPGLADRIPRGPSGLDPVASGEIDLFKEMYRWVSFVAATDRHETAYSTGGEGVGWACTGPVSYDPAEATRQLATLRAAADAAGIEPGRVFVPAVSPVSLYYFVNEYYDSDEAFAFAMADVLAQEYRMIVEAGFVLHVDDAVLWHKFATFRMSGGSERDYAAWAMPRIEALNHALDGIPQERVRYHICSGSGHSTKVFDPTLAEILPYVLRVNWGMLLFEQANVVHEHEWTVWQDAKLPEDRVLVPGVVTHHTHMVEHPELIAQRLVRLANLVGRERVMAGTDCGFAQSSYIARTDSWTQWAKLRSVVEGAQLASKRLWGGG